MPTIAMFHGIIIRMFPHSAPPVIRQASFCGADDMYLGVKSVTATDEYQLLIEFEGGEVRSFDVAPLLETGRFRELASLDVFKTARVAFDTVQWDNGLDLDPEYLYERSKPLHCEHAASEDKRSSFGT